jgi:hypothetical protein
MAKNIKPKSQPPAKPQPVKRREVGFRINDVRTFPLVDLKEQRLKTTRLHLLLFTVTFELSWLSS